MAPSPMAKDVPAERRLPAIFLVAFLLLLATLAGRAGELIAGASTPMRLEPAGSRLRWLPADRQGEGNGSKGSMAASLTPFFFIPVPINSASRQLLVTLPGIGPGLAERIVRYRRQHGPLQGRDQLLKVRGIGPHRLRALAPLVSFDNQTR